jgi:hypothetical protein
MFSVHVDDVTNGICVKPKSVLPVLGAEPTVDHQFQEVSRMPCDLLNVAAPCDLVQTAGILFDAFSKQVAYDGNPYVAYVFIWTIAQLFVKMLLVVAQSLHAPRSVSHLKWAAAHDCCPFLSFRANIVQSTYTQMYTRIAFSPTCSAICSHCGALNTFLGLSAVEAFICQQCGEGDAVAHPLV